VKVLGESFHPGGEKLTRYLCEKLGLNSGSVVLDVACGNGTSAITLARQFECNVIGIDLSEKNLKKARKKAQTTGFSDKIVFVRGDAEKINLNDNEFDALISECSLCTFPDKKTAISEMYRVLKKGGRVGITDVVINEVLPEKLNHILLHVLCVTGAMSSKGYQEYLHEGGFSGIQSEDHSYVMQELLNQGQKVLVGWNMVEKIFNVDLEKLLDLTKDEIHVLLKMAMGEVEKGTIGYGLFVGVK
jgi:ubiquinone/menaquinone biosynthesis C-methylase UbiE